MAGATLVTGAAGFAGGHLLDLLTGQTVPDHRTRTSGRVELVAWHRPGGPSTPRPGVKAEAVDLLDRQAVRESIARWRPALVYHCAGAAHVGRAWESTEATFAVNVRGTHYLLDAIRRAGSGARVMIPGSALVYRPAAEPLSEDHPLGPTSPYGLSKLAQELLGRHASTTGVEVTIARAFNHCGPRQDPSFSTSGFARQIAAIEAGLQPPEIAVGNLEARRDLTDVRDMVRAYRAIAENGRGGRPYNVCSGHAVTIREVLDMLVARARVPVQVRVDPARFRPNDVPLLVGDSRRARDELGWRPEVPLDRTLDDILLYWRGKVR